jgi:hypothetical protein
MVSGLVGDEPAPAFVGMGAFQALWIGLSTTHLSLELGRRAVTTSGMQLVGLLSTASAPTLDSASYGGCYLVSAINTLDAQVLVARTSDGLGTYHLLTRAYTTQLLANLGKVTAFSWAGDETNPSFTTPETSFVVGPSVTPFTAASTWTLADIGQITVPVSPRGGLTDLTKGYTWVYANINDSSGVGSPTERLNWGTLMPVDAQWLSATLYNGSFSVFTVTNSYIYFYADGLASAQGAWSTSAETSAIPNPAVGVGGPGSATGSAQGINPVGDSVMWLDPAQKGATAGVNQFAAVITDANGTVVPLAVEVAYRPQYLFPL